MDQIKVIVDPRIIKSVPELNVDELQLSVISLIKAGIIATDNDNSITVDIDLLREVIAGSEKINDAYDEYGIDEHGFVAYPFNDEQ